MNVVESGSEKGSREKMCQYYSQSLNGFVFPTLEWEEEEEREIYSVGLGGCGEHVISIITHVHS